MTSRAAPHRSHLAFIALEGLSLAGFILEMRPPRWVSGLIGRRHPVPLSMVTPPAPVMFGLSFFLR
ncbi:hypothetical protein [Deinococcus aestuarii]|uniref:hypothetical protein n=1 Tax=Deinococcus aestuarii TaxID=2774531 RepID=UPI001C0B4A91|nr:hypothetical protein [Deinococcus aestuarii]